MPDPKDAINILLAQFQALRGEIASRSGAQATMMQMTITAFGALAGLAFTQYGDHRLLLLIPVISTILGLIWLDHAANISNIGDFIRTQLMPLLKSEAEMKSLPDYEIFVLEYEQTSGKFMRMFGLPPFLTFVVVPFVAMIVALGVKPYGWLFWMLMVVDVILLVLFIKRWLPFVDSPRQKRSAV